MTEIASHRPRWAPLTLVAFVSLVICGYVGTAVAPKWANDNPEGLLMLHARIRHLLLALGGDIGWFSYAVIGGLRLALAFVVCHLIGRAYGDDVLRWFGRYLGASAESMKSMMAVFDKADWIVVPWFVGSNIVAVITGIRKMRPRRLATLLTIGISARLAFYWWLAQMFDDELDSVLSFLDRYQRPALIGSVVLMALIVGLNLRRGRNFVL